MNRKVIFDVLKNVNSATTHKVSQQYQPMQDNVKTFNIRNAGEVSSIINYFLSC